MLAYHWLREDMTTGSGNEPAWTVGEERTYKGRPALCHCGYHSSATLFQAFQYAPGPVACLVEISKPVDRDGNKQVSETRKLLAAVNVRCELLKWAADCAERALRREQDVGREPDKRCWDAITVVRRCADGNATEEETRAAADAAYAAYAAYAAANAADAAAHAAYAAANAAYAASAAAYAAHAAYAAYAASAAANAAAYAANAADAADARHNECAWQRQWFEELIVSRVRPPQGVPL